MHTTESCMDPFRGFQCCDVVQLYYLRGDQSHPFTDDQLSSSELRKRYLQGGLDDDQMSASQLRAKAGIPHNSKSAQGLAAKRRTLHKLTYSLQIGALNRARTIQQC